MACHQRETKVCTIVITETKVLLLVRKINTFIYDFQFNILFLFLFAIYLWKTYG